MHELPLEQRIENMQTNIRRWRQILASGRDLSGRAINEAQRRWVEDSLIQGEYIINGMRSELLRLNR